ncbi:hypothetical protein FJY63_13350 [Candidatus Sumerlaeota bacterium]|nr:hypothetical protein [Candidatus Sumerlaeota bacterium]
MDYDALERLVKLRDVGALTSAEFAEQREAILRPFEDRPCVQHQKDGLLSSTHVARRTVVIGVAALALILIVLAVVLPRILRGGGEAISTQYELVDPSDYVRKCQIAGQAASAYLAEGNRPKFEEWSSIESASCSIRDEVQGVQRRADDAFEDADAAAGEFLRGY